MMLEFKQLISPTPEIVQSFDKWANNPELKPLMRPHKNKAELHKKNSVTSSSLIERLKSNEIHLIYSDHHLVGEINFQTNFEHLYKQQPNTAWIGLVIGETISRNKGIGTLALAYLEKIIRLKGHKRIELGVFAFNTAALKLYKNSGYKEIGLIKDFTYFHGKMWPSICMEKYLSA